jgi:hypothetical protein
LFLQFGFLFPNIPLRYRGSKTKTFSMLEPKTDPIQTAEKEPARCQSFDFIRYYVVSAIEKAAVAFFAVAMNLQRRRRTRVRNRRLCFLEPFDHRRSWLTSPSLRSLQLYSRRLSGIMVGVVSFGALGRG